MPTTATILLLALTGALAPAPDEARDLTDFLRRDEPTFVVGTRGDDGADRAVRAQVRFVRGVLFPRAGVVDDTTVDVAAGPDGWPERPVLYGGAHVNAALADAADRLPLTVDDGVIEIAGRRYEGAEYRLIALVPSVPAGDERAGTPQFALYAGAGTPGVAEINATPDGGHGWIVADRFGLLDAGRWVRGDDGLPSAERTHQSLRKPWRTRAVREGEGTPVEVRVARLEHLPAAENEREVDRAILRGVRRTRSKLGLDQAEPLTVYVYPDERTKASLTRGGDGHADHASRTLHVETFSAEEGGALERLVAHEATHVLADEAFGSPGSALWGEGLAVWVADAYGGRSLLDWRADPPRLESDARALVGIGFFRKPERYTYPVAGLLVGDLIHEHGLEAFLEHAWPSGPDDLDEACRALGLRVERLDGYLRRYRER